MGGGTEKDRQSTVTRRASSVLGLTAAALLCLGCDATIASGLDESQANQILVALDAQGIGAHKERLASGVDETRWEVAVAPDDVGRALAVMRTADLPRKPERGIEEVFGEGSLVPTATEERARYASALAGELARSIESIDGVLDARVHVAIPERRDFALDDEPLRPRASVLVKHAAGREAPASQAVQALVSGAVHGMRPEDVAVVAVPGPAASVRGGPNLVHIGPIAVSQGSASVLKVVLGATLALNLILAIALIVTLTRRRRTHTTGALGEPA